MIWMWILLVALITLGAIVLFGKLPAAARPLAVAAVMVGVAGYALQGSPSLPGKPIVAPEQLEGFGEAITDRQQGMADRFGPAAQWIAMSDGFARTGKTALAAQTLEKGLERYPDNVDLWVGLGNALVAHGGGVMSPAAALAFDEAAKRDPNHPAEPASGAHPARCAVARGPRDAAGPIATGDGAGPFPQCADRALIQCYSCLSRWSKARQ